MALTVMLTYPLTLLAGGLVSESSSNAKVYFIHPSDGQGIKGKVSVVFGLKNMESHLPVPTAKLRASPFTDRYKKLTRFSDAFAIYR